MANEEHLAILKQGVGTWNEWRKQNPYIQPNLSHTFLTGIFSQSQPLLKGIRTKLSGINLSNAQLHDAFLEGADLDKADLRNADLTDVNLKWADLRGAHLNYANLKDANLRSAKLNEADLSDANLMRATLVETNLEGAILTNSNIYGTSVWGIKINEKTEQSNLLIANYNEPTITVDNIEVAQFVYLLIHNEKLRQVIDTITGKAVLILGRFTPDRKPILDALREHLRQRNYIPILFDFEKPDSRSLTETVITLAHLSRFVIADLTNPSSIPHELMSFVPKLKSVAVQPIILKEHRPYAMFEDLQGYNWVLPIHEYESQETLMAELVDKIIVPAEEKVKQLRPTLLS